MKQQVFIIIGALVVLLLVGVWAYLLFFGTPKSADDVFAELGLSGSEDTVTPLPPPVVEENPTVNLERPKLRQLTTKPVAGFKEIATTTPDTMSDLYYVEMGTGHIFSINLGSGEERRLSGTTVAKATQAAISKDGTLVAIGSPTNTKNLNLVLGTLSTSTVADLVLTSFSEPVTDFTVANSGELLFTKTSQTGTLGTAYNARTDRETTIFSVPFRDTRTMWGQSGTDSHYVYPKASYALEGFLYEARSNTLTRLPVDGFGFTAQANDDLIVYTASINQVPTTYLYNRETAERRALNSYVLPEKCFLPASGADILCAQDMTLPPYESPDSWYQGVTSFQDSLYIISADTFSAELLSDTFADSSREIDAVELEVGERGSAVYFINKNDNTLWMYEL